MFMLTYMNFIKWSSFDFTLSPIRNVKTMKLLKQIIFYKKKSIAHIAKLSTILLV